jgi:tetratricopeptide (TPR) repeat protein
LDELANKPEDVEQNMIVARKYLARWEGRMARPYFEKILHLDRKNKYGYNELATCEIAINDVWDQRNPDALEAFLKTSQNEELLKKSYSVLRRAYKHIKDSKNLIRIYEAETSRFKDDASILNEYAWYIHTEKLEAKYNKGVELAKQALKLKPEKANIWDTLAWLYDDINQKDKAIEAIQKAVELAPDKEGYKENLEKIKKKSI